MPFAMVSTGRTELGGGLKITQLGFNIQERWDLAKLCDEIDAPDLGLDTKSVPDVWAHLLKFHQSLTRQQRGNDEESEKDIEAAFEDVRNQWRGLLAFVVLRRELGIEGALALEPLFPDDEPVTGKFTQVAYELLPDNLRETKLDWRNVHSISYNGVTLGATSPLTFVCPAASAPMNNRGRAALSIQGCSWFANGEFADPVEHLEGPYLFCLRRWIDEAVQALKPDRLPDGYGNAIDSEQLRTELTSFDAELEAKLKRPDRRLHSATTAADVRTEHDQNFRAEMPVQQCLQLLVFTPNEISVQQVKASPFLLMPAPGATPKQNVLIVDQRLVKLPGFDNGKIEMLRGVTLNQAIDDYRKGEHNRLRAQNLEVCALYSGDEIFCPTLFVARVEDAFPGAHAFRGVSSLLKGEDGSPVTPMLPLSSEFLEHFTPEYLIENVEFRGSDSEITVTLNVTLNHMNRPGVRTVVPFSKTYRVADKTIQTARLPEVHIWPEYSERDLPGWSRWYTYYNDLDNPGAKLRMRPQRDYLVSETGGLSTIVDFNNRTKAIELAQTSRFPVVFECKLDGAAVGVLLAKANRLRKGEHSRGVEIGIDFGTTGTTVYATEEGNDKPVPVNLEPHILKLSNAARTESYRFFLPTQEENAAALLSVFKDFRGSNHDFNHVEPFTEGHISFAERMSSLGQMGDLETEGICADMKWGNTLERARGKAFIQQLCLLTALYVRVNGGKKARWVFSYPISFSATRQTTFRNIFRDCVTFALERSGLTPWGGDERKIRFRDESTCASRYANHHWNLSGAAVVLDIGGGSADISIWQRVGIDRKPVQNTSVRFAGRDMLQRPLLRKPEFLTHFATNERSRGLTRTIATNKRVRNNETIFFSQVDAFFNFEGEGLIKTLPLQAEDPDVKTFVGILQLGMQGLFFYIGQLLRGLKDHDAFDSALPDVFVCGNGSKILHWLSFGHFEQRGPAEYHLLQALLAGTGFPAEALGEARIFLSPEPKSEAACGMLIDPDLADVDNRFGDKPLQIVSGETFGVNGTAHEAQEIVPYDTVGTDRLTIPANPAMLSAFLKGTGRPALPARTLKEVVEATNDQLSTMIERRRTRGRGDLDAQREDEQPIFIVLLKELVKNAASDWAGGKPAWWL